VLIFTYIPDFLTGLWLTAAASFLAFAGGVVLGVLGAVGRRSTVWPLRAVATAYVEIFRNTPVLVQIFIVFFGLPAAGIHLPAFAAGVIGLALNAGAYLTEIIRTGFVSVPKGQLEAARTLGLTRSDVFFQVVLPQAIRTVYPPVVNEFMQIILATSLLSTIALNELTGVALIASSLTFESMPAFGVALLFYLILTNAVSFSAVQLGKFMFRAPLTVSDVRGGKARFGLSRVMEGAR
jgi:polar amino acid transport system permease protein